MSFEISFRSTRYLLDRPMNMISRSIVQIMMDKSLLLVGEFKTKGVPLCTSTIYTKAMTIQVVKVYWKLFIGHKHRKRLSDYTPLDRDQSRSGELGEQILRN
jgi:hypothetical protein